MLPRTARARPPLGDRINPYLGEILPVSRVLLKMLSPAHLENPHFGVASVRQNGRKHCSALNVRRANTHLGAIAERQNLRQRDLLTDLVGQRFDLEPIARVHAILLAARLNNREHYRPPHFGAATPRGKL